VPRSFELSCLVDRTKILPDHSFENKDASLFSRNNSGGREAESEVYYTNLQVDRPSPAARIASFTMAEGQLASLDGRLFCGTENNYRPDPKSMTQRSASIFSRRGTDAPEPKPTFIAQEAMRMPTHMTDRRQSWIRWKSISGGSSPKGTILNAVPPAPTIKMTALEEEMATSPNEEILSAVSVQSPTRAAWIVPQSNPWNRSVVSRAKSEKSRDDQKRIGIWADGITHWDKNAHHGHELRGEYIVEQETGFTPVRPTPDQVESGTRGRPDLSVLIPGEEKKPCRPVVSVAPANIVSRFTTMLPTVAVSEQLTPPRVQRRASPLLGTVDTPSDRSKQASRTSSSSSLVERDDVSVISKRSDRSSATSVEGDPVTQPELSSSITNETLYLNRALPPCPARAPQRRAPTPGGKSSKVTELSPDGRELRRSRLLTAHDTSTCEADWSEPSSPTLSQAENELQAHLSTIHKGTVMTNHVDLQSSEAALSRSASIRRGDNVHPPERAPTIPKRSRKREWRQSKSSLPQSLPIRRQSDRGLRAQDACFAVHRSRSINATEVKQICGIAQQPWMLGTKRESAVTPPLTTEVRAPVEEDTPPRVAVASAEAVLLRILSSTHTIDDLLSTATINKSMYRVYKENEIDLLHTVAFNQSPAAWECREWSTPDVTYLTAYRRDLAVIQSLKALMLERCQPFMRRETVLAFSTSSHPDAQRFDDAFWRIWCFCKIFGYDKGREEDITGQVDWLKGGLVTSTQGAVATINMNLDFDMGSVLLNAPEFFAKGNAGGLDAQQLYDVAEIWTCLSALLHDYTHEAEEWTYYLLTLGPAVVLDMATCGTAAGFALAEANGWMTWFPPSNGSRSVFLKEPASRLYEECTVSREEKEDVSRKRVANLAADIRLKRQSSAVSHRSARSDSILSPVSALSPCMPSWPPRKISPIIEGRVETFNRMSLVNFAAGIAEDTSERATNTIVEMGFSRRQAREALRSTDLGDGLRVDRAVELLLRRLSS